ncbi:hypothetical protein V8D89_001811, partial [Ganoderma adspersum]
KFWFDDLHVVLLSSDRVAFRVRRDCLEAASHRLQHLIADASKTADKRSPFGCPIVHLDVVSAGLEPFLEVVTDPMGNEKISWVAYRRSLSDEGCLSFSWLAVVARTAHELGACETEDAAFSRVRHFFMACSLSGSSFTAPRGSFQDSWAWWSKECGITVDVENAIEALNLVNVPRLPLTLYTCCLLSPAQLRNGVAREDGVIERLSDDDFDRCMRAIPSLHIANHNNLAKTFAAADDWECLGAHRSTFPCEGKHAMRKIRDVYIAHTRTPGPHRPDLRDLLSALRFKSLPYDELFAPGGSSLICRGCAERLVDSSATLCDEEENNLEKYFFPEESAPVEDHDANCSPVPKELETQTPPSESRPESESEKLSGSPTDVEATPDPLVPRISSTGKPSLTPPGPETSSQGGSETLSDRSESPADDDDDDDDEPRPTSTSPGSRSGRTSAAPTPYSLGLEIAMPPALALAAIGWDDGSDDDPLLLLSN